MRLCWAWKIGQDQPWWVLITNKEVVIKSAEDVEQPRCRRDRNPLFEILSKSFGVILGNLLPTYNSCLHSPIMRIRRNLNSRNKRNSTAVWESSKDHKLELSTLKCGCALTLALFVI